MDFPILIKLDEFIFNIRCIDLYFFNCKHSVSNGEENDQILRYDLGLYCLQMFN